MRTRQQPDTQEPVGQQALRNAVDAAAGYLERHQNANGSVAGEVIWCPMLAAQYVIASHVMGKPIADERQRRLVTYFEQWQRPDGGYGLHIESHSYLFTSVLVYAALRLLGLPTDHPVVERLGRWLAPRDVTGVPTWGKLWLALAGVYDYEGIHPVPPEMWLLPRWFPAHPSRWYCHTRLIYLGFSYLYGARVSAPVSALTRAIRAELYPGGYESVDWVAARGRLHESDLFVPPDRLLKTAYAALGRYERIAPGALRKRGLAAALERIVFEERSTRYSCISPVNGLLNTLSMFHAGHPETDQAFDGVEHWVWEDDEDGFRLAGAASNSWDTAFAVQALTDDRYPERHQRLVGRLQTFLKSAQIREELPEGFEAFDRLPAVGGYCFGEPHHNWPVSDCTAEAVLADLHVGRSIPNAPRMADVDVARAVRFILARQNEDGGFGSYECQRGARYLEQVNPSEMFGNCMTEYSYLECTSSCLQALAGVLADRPETLAPGLANEVRAAVKRAEARVRALQLPDGSWQGIWGVNYTYGTLFGVSALLAAGATGRDSSIRAACRWVLAHQLPEGGWGESLESAVTHQYVPHETPQAIMTAWAMMTLLRAGDRSAEATDALRRGAELLEALQDEDGSWPVQGQAGIFFHTAGLHYDLYRVTFPAWALGLYARRRAEV